MRPQTKIDQARGQRSRCVRSASRPRAIHNAWRRLSSSRQSRHRTAATADRLPSCVNWSKSPGAARRPHSSSCRRLGGMVPPPLGISARRGAAGASTGHHRGGKPGSIPAQIFGRPLGLDRDRVRSADGGHLLIRTNRQAWSTVTARLANRVADARNLRPPTTRDSLTGVHTQSGPR